MSIRVTIDDANWLHIPGVFPHGDAASADEWVEQIVERMRRAWSGELDEATEREVRAELIRGLDSVRPEDSIVLQYWRWSAPVAAVVHLVLGRFDEGGERPAYLLGEGALVADPAFEIVTAQHLGEGVEVRMLSRPEGEDFDVAGLTQLYVSGDRFLGVGVDAAPPTLFALLLGDLRDLLDTVEIDDDGPDAWERSHVDESSLPDGDPWGLHAAAGVGTATDVTARDA